MDEQLCDTFVTGQTINDLMRECTELNLNGHHLVGVEAAAFGAGQGFTSKILRVKLTWSDAAAGLPESIIVKVIGSKALGEMMSHMSKEKLDVLHDNLFHAHNVECSIYEIPSLRKIVRMPECYGKLRSLDKNPGTIILQDLSDRGVVRPPTTWGLGFSQGQLDDLVESLASVHAWSVNRTEWRKVIPSLAEFNVLAPLVESLVMVFPASKKKYPDLFKELDETKVNENINSDKYLELFGCDPKARYNLPLVLVHGDVHQMNMLFEKKEGGDGIGDKLVALIDWQVAHQGCLAEDLARILVLCLSTKQRREDGDKVIRKYVELFNSKVTDSQNHITFEDTKRALNDMYAFFAIMWCCGMAMFEQMEHLMKDIDASKIKEFMDLMYEYQASNYEDAMEILKW